MTKAVEIEVSHDNGNRDQYLSVTRGRFGMGVITRYPSLMMVSATKLDHQIRSNTSYVTVNRQTTVIGEGAKIYGNKARAVHTKDFGNGNAKVDAQLTFLLGMIPFQSEQGVDVVTVQRLRTMHPLPTAATVKEIQDNLVGEHRCTVNGRERVITIEQVEVYAEPVPSYFSLAAQGAVRPQAGTYIIIDTGGLTALIQAFNEYGIISPEEGGRIALEMGGVRALAEMIGRDIQKEQLTKGPASTQQIMDALHTGYTTVAAEGKRFLYGTGVNSFYFDHLVRPNLKVWRDECFGTYAPMAHQYGETWAGTWFVGGGTHYFMDAIKAMQAAGMSGYSCSPHPELENINGLIHVSNPRLVESLGFTDYPYIRVAA